MLITKFGLTYHLGLGQGKKQLCCKAKGLSLAVIMQSAGWSNSSTFAKLYGKPVDTASVNFGSVLLNPDTL